MYFLNGPASPILHAFAGAFKTLGYLFLAPLLLIALLGALFVVVLDFTIFRIHDLILGHPEPKGLWEF